MTTVHRWIAFLAIAALQPASAAYAAPAAHQRADADALALAQKAIALRSVHGPGNQAPQVAALFGDALAAGSGGRINVRITPMDDTAYLIANWPGRDRALKPIVILGHLDVVEAKRSDWQRDPFTPVIENGSLYGRGATDMKLDGAIAISAVLELLRQGYQPRRSIVLAFSGDEETAMKSSQLLARDLAKSDLVLNIDGGGGVLDEATGKPKFFSWSADEKSYADYRLTVTNPGGHSSQPPQLNAIDELAAALLKIHDHRFKPELGEVNKAFFLGAARFEAPATAAAMRTFAADPTNESAIATLAAVPSLVGEIGTTCVVTMIEGGHAPNALPQKVTANVNCRIFPGHSRAEVMAELKATIADPAVAFENLSMMRGETGASQIRPEFVHALTKALAVAYPGVPAFPEVSAGASDSIWFRALGVPSYSASPTFVKQSEQFSHGLNEHTPLFNIPRGIDYYMSIIPSLSS